MQNLKKNSLLEKEIEKAKEELSTKIDFNLNDFFSIFDTSNKGFITLEELERGLTDFGLHPKSHELFLFIQRFDLSEKGFLR